MDAVARLLREAAEAYVLPMFGRGEAAPEQKAPGEWVTAADRAAEDFLSPRLAALVPGSVVIGEEAAFADPGILDRIGAENVWLLDPLDGTASFAAGTGPFALMAALVRNGETAAAWLYDPLSGRMASAGRGAGAWLDGTRVRTSPAVSPVAVLSGAVLSRFLPRELSRRVAAASSRFAQVSSGTGCAGADYPAVVTGAQDFVLYWRTLPWDHAPGALFASEAGGVACRLDGSPFRPAAHARNGLLVARNLAIWKLVHAELGLPGGPALLPGPVMDPTLTPGPGAAGGDQERRSESR